MQLGAVLLPTSADPATGALTERARELEQTGFDSLWAVQAAGRGGFLPDPLQVLAAAATATTRPRLGTAVLQLPLYPTAALAHQLLSLQHFAGDRLCIGVGCGSTESDFRIFEQDYASRFEQFDRQLVELRQLLATGKAEDIDLSPPQALAGGPSLLYGTWGKRVARAATEFAGWIGSALYRSDEQVIASLKTYREHGGKRAIISSIVIGSGDEKAHRARLDAFAEAGFDEAVVMLRPDGPGPDQVRRWVATA